MSDAVRLSVNLNKVALVRTSRPGSRVPALDRCARVALAAGAAGITLHPRPDQRHARYDDLAVLAGVVLEAGAELNVEGNPFCARWEDTVRRVRPAQATLVPDPPGAATSERGWKLGVEPRSDAPRAGELGEKIRALQALGIRVSLFVEPDPDAVGAAARLGADRVELRTQPYADACTAGHPAAAIEDCRRAATVAKGLGLGLNAGHDLDLENLPGILTLPGLQEVSIGHALIAGAILEGLGTVVARYAALVATGGRKVPPRAAHGNVSGRGA